MNFSLISKIANDASLIVKKNKYINLKDNILILIQKLNSSIKYLDCASKNISNFYSVDDIWIEYNKIENNKKSLIKIKDNLSNIIIPQIDQKIDELSIQTV